MIPQGWQEKTLGEVCEIISGTTPDTSNNEFWGKGNYWITPAEINEDSLYINGTARTITNRAVECCSLRKMPRGTVLFSSRAPIGKIAISNVDVLYCNQGFKNFICSKNINNKFLYYFLFKNKKYLISLGKGTTFKEVSKSIISVVNIQYPPLPEQERIVAKLDKAFEAIDKVKANAEQNLNNTKELFNNTLDSKIRTLYKNSSTQKLSEVCDVRDGTHDSPKYLDKRGHPFVTSKNLKNDKIDMEKITYISDSDFEKINERSKVDIGDVLFAMIGTIGNPVVITEEPDFAIKNVALFKNINKLEPQYLKFLLKSPSVLLKMQLEANGTTQKFVSLKYLRNFMVPVPSLSEQQKIVEKLDALQEQTKKLEQIYTQKIKECDELKQSILQKAFRGEL